MENLSRMITNIFRAFLPLFAVVLLTLGSTQAIFAANKAKHKVVIQISTNDPKIHKMALSNAVNVQKLLGMDNVVVEIVAYGPGLGLLTTESKQALRVKSLALQNITFSACGYTMAKIERKTGKKLKLTEGVKKVNVGVARIMELQEQGYSYVRP
jgi:intracellular sulfur oxidation DsrE/DsrF family protein